MFVRAHPFLRVIDDQIASAAYFLTAQDPWRQITPSGFRSLPHLKTGFRRRHPAQKSKISPMRVKSSEVKTSSAAGASFGASSIFTTAGDP